LPFHYEDVKPDIGYRIHILVEEIVNVEVKSAKALTNVHYKQVLAYLKLSDKNWVACQFQYY
jgi:GxxExxY protein